ncbi:MAG: hypothetical protein IPI58_09630 [Alphaproteobacteria bacterium]|nr:MAG: hypothetical protein IPI58_09630 [Alphaproteobacteria bacterium]
MRIFCLIALMLTLSSCLTDSQAPNTPRYRILVTEDAKGNKIAVPPDCAKWSDDNQDHLSNAVYSDWGCANARNLASMVEDPQDLLRGHNPAVADGIVAAGAIKRYRLGKAKALIDPNAPAVQDRSVASTGNEDD